MVALFSSLKLSAILMKLWRAFVNFLASVSVTARQPESVFIYLAVASWLIVGNVVRLVVCFGGLSLFNTINLILTVYTVNESWLVTET